MNDLALVPLDIDDPVDDSIQLISSCPATPEVLVHVGFDDTHVQALCDTGAKQAYVSSDLTKRLKLNVDTLSPSVVRVADGRAVRALGKVSLQCRIMGSEVLIIASVIDGLPQDMILGMMWLSRLGIIIDTKTGTATMGSPAPVEQINMMEDASFCDQAQFWKHVKKQDKCFLLWIKEAPEEVIVQPEEDPNTPPGSGDDEIDRTLKEFAGVFRKDLPITERPSEIPDTRTLRDSIIPTGDHKPVNIRSYQLSASQLAEQDRQIKDLVDKGLVRESSSSWGFPVLLFLRRVGSIVCASTTVPSIIGPKRIRIHCPGFKTV